MKKIRYIKRRISETSEQNEPFTAFQIRANDILHELQYDHEVLSVQFLNANLIGVVYEKRYN